MWIFFIKLLAINTTSTKFDSFDSLFDKIKY